MRDIKFRAWDKTNKCMHESVNIYNGCPYFVMSDGSINPTLEVTTDSSNTYMSILMQYTGLKDKNGVEIYEGDICTQLYIRKFGEQDNPRLQGQVTFDATRGWCVAFEPIWPNDIEVIGNIYQNKDLLK